MLYDPSNPVVQLCVKGIETEYSGDLDKANALYQEAWQSAGNPLEFLTAAHYLARTQSDPRESLKWNLLALEYADKADNLDTAAFYPSLYLNVARSYEELGNPQQAHDHYLLAQRCTNDLQGDGYGDMIRKGILAGLERTGANMDGPAPPAR
jgi:tetratricopeptide (TPR) repeat protein